MMKIRNKFLIVLSISLSILLSLTNIYPLDDDYEEINFLTETETNEIEKLINKNMSDGKIPGVSIIIVKDEKTVYQRGFGYSDIEERNPVTSSTLFELASNSKAFTALAILSLEESGQIDLNDQVDKYIPWLKVKYKGNEIPITIEQVLHQTSGIASFTINMIPVSDEDSALEETVRTLAGIELDSEPGKMFQYATINYDILGLIIEKVTGNTYENYIDEIILKPMELRSTYLFRNKDINERVASGYKIGFLKPRLYEAPIYRGNKPAGYIISSGQDMAKWLKIQMGTMNELNFDKDTIKKSHEASTVVDARGKEVLYAGGWFIEPKGQITHDGMNPNYSSFITFNNKEKIGISVLSNMKSNHIQNMGLGINGVLHEVVSNKNIEDSNQLIDKLAVGILFILCIIILLVSFLLIKILIKIFRKQIHLKYNDIKTSFKLSFSLVFMFGLSYFIFLIPKIILSGFSWETAFVWNPCSIKVTLYAFYITIWFTYILFIFRTIFKKQL